MEKLKCIVSYDGSQFSGFQIQPHKRTVQAEVEEALKRMHKGQAIRIHSSGRTDKGVHARGQVFHFETSLHIPAARWKKALQALLPNDIEIIEVTSVSASFHARFDAVEKEYRYYILNRDKRDVFTRNYMYFERDKLNMEKLVAACKQFEGTHDFTTFSSARASVKGSRVRTLHEVNATKTDDVIEIIFRGDGFLYHMVRIITGVILDVAKGKLMPSDIESLFKAKNREKVGMTMPPEGLYLWHVTYKEND